MAIVFSIRGTNGSGKSTIARRFLPAPMEPGRVELNAYPAPTKREPDRKLRVEGYIRSSQQLGRIGVVGSYRTACGGLDGIVNFEVQRGAISWMIDVEQCDHVIAEGLLASGVYGSWGEFSKLLRAQGHTYAFCYLQTPLGVCKERILKRQADALAASGRARREINWQLVEDKFNSVRGNRDIALRNGEAVYDLPFGGEVSAVIDIMQGKGEGWRATA